MSQSEEFDRNKFIEEVKHELNTADRFRNYFSQYNEISVESFITSYSMEKALWHQFGEFYITQNEQEQTRWIDKAHIHLGYILQKKLFDAQCLWRAAQVKFEGVLHTYDFNIWERNIFNCPFIEPITETEIEMYQQFLNQPSNDVKTDIFFFFEWQNYSEIKKIYSDIEEEDINGEMPEWYEFHMNRTGTSSLLLLPDIIGDKENLYMKLVHDSQKDELAKAIKEAEKTADKRPYLKYYDKDILEFFIKTFEPQMTLEYYKAYKLYSRNRYSERSMEQIIDVLINEDIVIPIEAHHDWRDALKIAYAKYERKKIAENLPIAYEQYSMNISMNIAFPTEESSPLQDEMRQHFIERCIKGRMMNGETPDLNY